MKEKKRDAVIARHHITHLSKTRVWIDGKVIFSFPFAPLMLLVSVHVVIVTTYDCEKADDDLRNNICICV